PVQRGYEFLLSKIVNRPRRAYVAVGATTMLGVAVLPLLGQSLLPSFKERDFLMHWVTDPSASHPEETRITIQSSKELRAIPGVRNFGAHIGQALLMDEVVGVNFGENWISVDQEVDYDTTLASIQEVVDGYPGVYRDVQTYLKERIREVLTGASEAVVVRLYGEDLNTLRQKAQEVQQVLSEVDGLVEEHVDLAVDVPQIEVQVDLAAAERHGLKPGDVRRAAGVLVAGEEVGDMFRGGKAYDVQVWSTPETRNSLTSIQRLPIDTPAGDRVLLEEVADVRVAPTPNQIERDQGSRRIDVGANVGDGGDLGAIVSDIQDGLQGVQFPLGVHAEVLGEHAERQAAQQRLL
ncbi:MAG: efflux RND transporter permease subunit, partial [Pseudonocardiaceae bacterium]